MFSLRYTLAKRRLPPGYNINMGIVVLCGRRPASITVLRSSPCPESVIVHFKSLLPINNRVNQFIDSQFTAMQRLFAEGGVAVLPGTIEDLSGDPNLHPLRNLDVGRCILGQPTQDHNDLFANRNNVGNNELVIYIVSMLIGRDGNPIGCATHPNGRPGAAVVQSDAAWLVGHEVGHVLGLRHVCEFPSIDDPTPDVPCGAGGRRHSDQLMFPNVGWTNVPPDLAAAEYLAMVNSGLTHPC